MKDAVERSTCLPPSYWKPRTQAGVRLLRAIRRFSQTEIDQLLRKTYRIAMSDDDDRLGHKKLFLDLYKWSQERHEAARANTERSVEIIIMKDHDRDAGRKALEEVRASKANS